MHPLEWISVHCTDLRSIVCLASINKDFYEFWRCRWRSNPRFLAFVKSKIDMLEQFRKINFCARYSLPPSLFRVDPKTDVLLWIVQTWIQYFRDQDVRVCLFMYGSNLHLNHTWTEPWNSDFRDSINIDSIHHIRMCSESSTSLGSPPTLYKISYMNDHGRPVVDWMTLHDKQTIHLLGVILSSNIWSLEWSFHCPPALPFPLFSPCLQKTLQWSWTPLWIRHQTKRSWYQRLPWVKPSQKRPKLTLQNRPFHRAKCWKHANTYWRFNPSDTIKK